MNSCRQGWGSQGWDREARREWKRQRRDEWRQQREQWRGRSSRPGYGWSGINIAAMVIGFIVFWPLGMAILVWNILSSKFGVRMPAFSAMQGAANWGGAPWSSTNRDLNRNSGNAVFEDYKRATLERLEDERRKLVAEQEAFASFLDDLKRAKDRTEFEHFMHERELKREQGVDPKTAPADSIKPTVVDGNKPDSAGRL